MRSTDGPRSSRLGKKKLNAELTLVWKKYNFSAKLRIKSTSLRTSCFRLLRLVGLKCG